MSRAGLADRYTERRETQSRCPERFSVLGAARRTLRDTLVANFLLARYGIATAFATATDLLAQSTEYGTLVGVENRSDPLSSHPPNQRHSRKGRAS